MQKLTLRVEVAGRPR